VEPAIPAQLPIISAPGPHQGQAVLTAGEPLERARAAVVLMHGRGASADQILTLADKLAVPGVAYLAPQAAGRDWYPKRYFVPTADNEPGLSAALATIDELFARATAAGISPERVVLLGFSQGACLVLEYAARHGGRLGGVVGLSGALMGPDREPRHDSGALAGTPVFLGCGDADEYFTAARIRAAAETLRSLGASVTLRLYPGEGHRINRDEVESVREMLAALG
jgi:predicted esterase